MPSGSNAFICAIKSADERAVFRLEPILPGVGVEPRCAGDAGVERCVLLVLTGDAGVESMRVRFSGGACMSFSITPALC